MQQFYATGRYVPREVLVAAELPDGELLQAWLAERRGTSVAIRVPQRGEKLRLLELVVRNARLAFELEWKHPRKQSQELLRALRDLLDLEVEPHRIECFDISNIQGSDIVASMVVFEEGLPKKSDYRKFKVRGVSGAPDDFASMREVVTRRYQRLLEEGKEMPDLVLIDGGKGQLGAAAGALEDLGLGDQPLASLAKREELIFLRGRDEPIALPHSSPVLQLVQRVRDEAHRFADRLPPPAALEPDAALGARRGPGRRPAPSAACCSRRSARCAACAGRPRASWPRWSAAPSPRASARTSTARRSPPSAAGARRPPGSRAPGGPRTPSRPWRSPRAP